MVRSKSDIPNDGFGNLDEWERVLNQLQQFARDGSLDDRQQGLVLLLRFPDNWRLREAALEAVCDVKQPTEALVSEVLQIMMNEQLYYEARVLAAEALAKLVPAARSSPTGRNRPLEVQVIEQMHALLDSPHPPVLHQAVQRALPSIE